MNLSDIITGNASLNPTGKAIIQGDDGREVTWIELEKMINKLGHALTYMGVTKGDIVALYLPNCPEFIATYFAATKIGAIILPFNIVFKSQEITYILNDSGARVLVGASEQIENNVIIEQLPNLEKIITLGKTIEGCLDFYSMIEEASDTLCPVECSADDVLSLVYTSGTSGSPKGAMLTYGNLITLGTYNMRILHINDRDLVYSAPPLCHIVFLISVIGPFCAGAGIILLKHFNAEKSLEVMTRYQATHVIAVPTMYIYMLQSYDSDKHDLQSLRLAFCAGGPMPPQYIGEIEERFGLSFCEQYGTTETTSIISYNRMGHRRIGSVGAPVCGVAVKIVDLDGKDLAAGEIGEILVKGPGNCKGYWKMPEATEQAFVEGWFRTGDLGYFDDDGYLYIVDRLKDMIVSGGYNVYPREVEDIIYTNDNVAEVAVLGMKDPVRQEIPVAYVVLKHGHQIEEKELIDYCSERMAFYKVPRKVEFVGELPKGPTGKILKRGLKDCVVKA
jgi:long-chain acyl-CoA synthetase